MVRALVSFAATVAAAVATDEQFERRFADPAEALDAAFRHGERPARRLRWNGMRLARSIPP